MRPAAILVAWAWLAIVSPAPAQEGAEVEIRGTLLPRGEDPTGASTTIEGDRLDRPGASTADILQGSPSVQVARTGGAAELATVSLRAASSAQTPVYLGPIVLNDELTGTADLSTVPPFFLRRIQIHRGFAPIELERPGLGGAVVLSAEVARTTQIGASLGVGSFGERYAGGFATFASPNAGAAVSFRLDQTRGSFRYRDDRGTRFDVSDDVEVERDNADARAVDLWSAARFSAGSRASLSALVRVFAREQGVPGLGVLPASEARATTQQALGIVHSDLSCGPTAAPDECRVRLDGWGRATSYRLDDPARELLLGTPRQVSEALTAGTRLSLLVRPAEPITLQVGTGLQRAWLAFDPLGAYDARASRTSVRLFGAATLNPRRWLDLRLEGAVATDTLNGPPTFPVEQRTRVLQLAPQARLGAALRPLEGLELFAAVGRFVRVPTLGEQYGVSATVFGNAGLRPESSWNGDLGARGELRPGQAVVLAAEASFFGRSASDLIAYERSSFGALRPFNVAGARVLGVELTAAAKFLELIELGASVTWNDARDVSEERTTVEDRLPFQANFELSPRAAIAAQRLAPRFGLDAARAALTLCYRSPRIADPAGLIQLPSQVLLDVEGAVELVGSLSVALRISNVLDDQTTDLVGYPLPGRAGHLSIAGAWP